MTFTMTRAADGKEVTAADYKGKVVLLYFGYTFCPDVCPTTLYNLTLVLKTLGSWADKARVLFVTVDPNRDTLTVLKEYTSSFSPPPDGLRGTADQTAALARRFRIAYSARPATKDHSYEVVHSSAVYVFDANGEAKLLLPEMGSASPDVAGTAADLRRLIAGPAQSSVWERLLNLL